MKNSLLVLAILLAAPARPARSSPGVEVDGATTFLVRFERSARPDFSLSPTEFSGNAELIEGHLQGELLRLRPFTWVRYSMDAATFPLAEGTMEFRLYPEWPFTRSMAASVLSLSAGSTDYINVNSLANGRFGAAMRGSSRGDPEWGRADVLLDRAEWNRWRHVAVTWGPDGLALFFDGKLVSRTTKAAPLAKHPSELRIGGGDFRIADLRISDTVRYPSSSRPVLTKPRPDRSREAYDLFEPPGVYRAGWAIPESGPAIRLAVKHYADDFEPETEPDWSTAGTGIEVRAARGETEPAAFILHAARDLTGVEVEVRGIPAVVRRVVRAPMRRVYAGKASDHEIVGRFLPRHLAEDIPAGEFRELWLTLSVPEDAEPGTRRGEVRVTARGGESAVLPLTLTVLPFTLPPDPAKRMGMYYRIAGRLLDPGRLRGELSDLRAHGVTDLVLDVGLTWYRDWEEVRCDESALRHALGELTRAGFSDTVVVGDGLTRLAALVPDLSSGEFSRAAREGARLLKKLRREFKDLRIAVTHMDEVFNRDRLDRYIELARAARRAGFGPLYITFHTRDEEADRQRARIDRYVDIRGHHGYTFEWWLARGHTIKEYRRELERSGDEAWIYHNVRGSFFPAIWGRLVNGIYLKASPFTLNCPWIYQSYGKNPFDDTDSERHDFGFSFPRGDELVPTRIYECLREGQDDCRYLALLERTALAARKKRPRASREALEFLRRVEGLVTGATVADPSGEPSEPAGDGPVDLDTGLRFGVGKTGTRGEAPLIDALSRRLDGAALDAIRREAADRILSLTTSGALAIGARDAGGKPLGRVLVTVMGDRGEPVLDLYDKGVDLDAEGRAVIADIPAGRYSVRIHREREFQRNEGFDAVHTARVAIGLGAGPAKLEARLEPGGRMRVTVTDQAGSGVPARLVVRDESGERVATTFWRGKEGGWTTEHLPLDPGVVSCVLPPGRYLVQALQYGKVVAAGELAIVAGEVGEIALRIR